MPAESRCQLLTQSAITDLSLLQTRFQIASISKLFCAIAIGIALSENGFAQIYQTRIKDIAAEYELTDKAVGEQVTVEDALAHMTGLPRHDHFMSHEMHDLSDLVSVSIRLQIGLIHGFGHLELTCVGRTAID